MKFDKNTIIGFSLLAILFIGFFWYNNKQQQATMAYQEQKQKHEDSLRQANAPKVDTTTARIDSTKNADAQKISNAANFKTAIDGKEELTVVENELMKVAFSNKGGRVQYVQLKNYKSHDSSLVKLGSDSDVISYTINTGDRSSELVTNLFFTTTGTVKNVDGSTTINYLLKDSLNESITHQFIVRPNEYMIDWNINIEGANKLFTGNTLNMQMLLQPQQHEFSAAYEKRVSNICFSEGNEFDYIQTKSEWKFEKPVQWIGFGQQFFNTILVAKNSFSDGGNVRWERGIDSNTTLAHITVDLHTKLPSANAVNIPLQLYYGPNDFHILKNEAKGMEEMVNLGRGIYTFVRPINKYIIMPVFGFFAVLVNNYGWAILLLTVFIRLVIAPLTYSSYVSSAKMKLLRPELDELKKKFGSDQQGFAMEQMKFLKQAGASPLGGCLPALLQIPVFFSLYSFFNSNIALRGQSFLWSHDLSQYDSILQLPFTIPLGFGDHVSLFTITAVITSFLISLYNMSSTPTQDNPALKYMPYIFPFMMLFFFNQLPSALTWYYTVSNTLTLLLQFVIQKYIIDHDKIMANIDERRKAPKKKSKSKWQEKYEQMMESQKKIQDMKNRSQNKK
jgi:YidC/Oxa1 family membrane protein insertase